MRYHFVNCTDPLKEGEDTLAACGEVVRRPQFALWVQTVSGKNCRTDWCT